MASMQRRDIKSNYAASLIALILVLPFKLVALSFIPHNLIFISLTTAFFSCIIYLTKYYLLNKCLPSFKSIGLHFVVAFTISYLIPITGVDTFLSLIYDKLLVLFDLKKISVTWFKSFSAAVNSFICLIHEKLLVLLDLKGKSVSWLFYKSLPAGVANDLSLGSSSVGVTHLFAESSSSGSQSSGQPSASSGQPSASSGQPNIPWGHPYHEGSNYQLDRKLNPRLVNPSPRPRYDTSLGPVSSNNPTRLIDKHLANMDNESNLTEYMENRRRMSSELTNMSYSISNKLTHLQDSNIAFDDYFVEAKHNMNIGNLSEGQRLTELARNQKLDIRAKLASIEADINTRTNLAMRADRSWPGSKFMDFAYVKNSQLNLIDISKTYLYGPKWQI